MEMIQLFKSHPQTQSRKYEALKLDELLKERYSAILIGTRVPSNHLKQQKSSELHASNPGFFSFLSI